MQSTAAAGNMAAVVEARDQYAAAMNEVRPLIYLPLPAFYLY